MYSLSRRAGRPAGLRRPIGAGRLSRRDRGLLVDRHDYRVGGRIDVEPADLGCLGVEVRPKLAHDPVLGQVRTHVGVAQNLVRFGTPVQRCIRHKTRNVLDHLPERDRPAVKRRLRTAWKLDDHATALGRLQALADELARSHPGAAASLREGMAETLTVTRLGIRGALKHTLESTNPCESMIECVRRTSRNVKRWQSGDMPLRWTAAGMLEAEQQFRKVIGYRDLAKLAIAVERDLTAAVRSPTAEEAATLVTA